MKQAAKFFPALVAFTTATSWGLPANAALGKKLEDFKKTPIALLASQEGAKVSNQKLGQGTLYLWDAETWRTAAVIQGGKVKQEGLIFGVRLGSDDQTVIDKLFKFSNSLSVGPVTRQGMVADIASFLLSDSEKRIWFDDQLLVNMEKSMISDELWLVTIMAEEPSTEIKNGYRKLKAAEREEAKAVEARRIKQAQEQAGAERYLAEQQAAQERRDAEEAQARADEEKRRLAEQQAEKERRAAEHKAAEERQRIADEKRRRALEEKRIAEEKQRLADREASQWRPTFSLAAEGIQSPAGTFTFLSIAGSPLNTPWVSPVLKAGLYPGAPSQTTNATSSVTYADGRAYSLQLHLLFPGSRNLDFWPSLAQGNPSAEKFILQAGPFVRTAFIDNPSARQIVTSGGIGLKAGWRYDFGTLQLFLDWPLVYLSDDPLRTQTVGLGFEF